MTTVNIEYPVSIDTLDRKLAWLIRQIELSRQEHNASLIGKEHTPEWKAWHARHIALAGELAVIKEQANSLKVSAPADLSKEAPESQLKFLLKQEQEILIRDRNIDNADEIINQRSALIESIKNDASWDVK